MRICGGLGIPFIKVRKIRRSRNSRLRVKLIIIRSKSIKFLIDCNVRQVRLEYMRKMLTRNGLSKTYQRYIRIFGFSW